MDTLNSRVPHNLFLAQIIKDLPLTANCAQTSNACVVLLCIILYLVQFMIIIRLAMDLTK